MEINLKKYPDLVSVLKSEYDWIDMRRTGQYHGNGTELISVAVSVGHGSNSQQAAALFSAGELEFPRLVARVFKSHFENRKIRE